uniref:Single domain-containing protein n=1 Tax=Graphocephala atropunctata TaxID=36148 RepID=A0A1B6L216_9HEMI
MFAFVSVILVYTTVSHGHQFIGPHQGFHGAVKTAWGTSSASRGSWSGYSTPTRQSTSTPAVKDAWGTYHGNTGLFPPARGTPPSSWSAGYPSRGSAPYPASNTTPYSGTPPRRSAPYSAPNYPPRQGSGGSATPKPPVSVPYPPPASSMNSNRIGGNQEAIPPPTKNTVTTTTNSCREGDKVYRVGDKWTPEGSCGRHSCVDDGKTSILGCPKLEASLGCTLSDGDARQPWPSCCPQVQCIR